MTNADLLAKIKAEIEKRKCSIKMYCLKSGHDKRYDVVPEQLENILSFLSTLEAENPSDGLEEEIKKYCNDYYNCNYPDQIQNGRCSPVMPHIVEAARHFAQWGAEQAREQMMKEAVEGEYGYFSNASKTILPSGKLNIKEGDKVRIIIVKES